MSKRDDPGIGVAARCFLGIAVALVFLLALRAARPLLLPLLFAPLLALLFAAPTRWLRRRGVPECVGAGLIVATVSLAVCALGAALAGPAARWWYSLPSALQAVVEALSRLHVDALAPGSIEALRRTLTSEGVSLTRLVLGDVLVLSAQAAATAVLLYFLLLGQRSMLHRWLSVLPSRPARRRLLATLVECERDVRRFIGAMTLANLALGAATGLLLLAIGLPHALLWAVAVAVLTFIPYVGPFVVFVLLTIAGSVAFGRGSQALLPALGFLALHALEANLISPWWMGYRLRLNRVAVFVAVMVFGWAWGVAGGFLAVPLLLVLRAICRREPGMRLASVWLEAEDAPVAAAASSPGAGAQVRGLPR